MGVHVPVDKEGEEDGEKVEEPPGCPHTHRHTVLRLLLLLVRGAKDGGRSILITTINTR